MSYQHGIVTTVATVIPGPTDRPRVVYTSNQDIWIGTSGVTVGTGTPVARDGEYLLESGTTWYAIARKDTPVSVRFYDDLDPDFKASAIQSGGGGGGVTDHGALLGLADDDHPLYAKVASNLSDLASAATARSNLGLTGMATAVFGTASGEVAQGNDARFTRVIPATFTVTGAVAAGQFQPRFYVDRAYTILSVRASVGTAPTGASLIVDVNKNGTTIFTTQGSRPTIAASGFTATNSAAPDVATLASGDYLTVDVDQVGSTVAGSNLTVQVFLAVA